MDCPRSKNKLIFSLNRSKSKYFKFGLKEGREEDWVFLAGWLWWRHSPCDILSEPFLDCPKALLCCSRVIFKLASAHRKARPFVNTTRRNDCFVSVFKCCLNKCLPCIQLFLKLLTIALYRVIPPSLVSCIVV